MKTKVVYQLKLWILGIKYREKTKKKDILKNLYALFDGRKRVLDAFERRIFPIKIWKFANEIK